MDVGHHEEFEDDRDRQVAQLLGVWDREDRDRYRQMVAREDDGASDEDDRDAMRDPNAEPDPTTDDCEMNEERPRSSSSDASQKGKRARARAILKQRIDYCQAVVKNKRQERIRLERHGRSACWRVTEAGGVRTYAGLTKRLAEVFFTSDEYDYHLQQSSHVEVADDGTVTDVVDRGVRVEGGAQVRVEGGDISGVPKNTCKGHGTEHGTIVHTEIQRFFICRLSHTSGYEAYMSQYRERPDRCSLNVLRYFRACQWQPLAAELPLFDSTLGIATAVDFVLMNLQTKQQCVAVELKTGYDGAPNTESCFFGHLGTPFMRPPLDFVRDSPYQRACLQLLVSYMMWVMGERAERGYGVQVAVPHELYVVHVRPSKSTPVRYVIAEWANRQDVRDAIYNRLADFERERRARSRLACDGTLVESSAPPKRKRGATRGRGSKARALLT